MKKLINIVPLFIFSLLLSGGVIHAAGVSPNESDLEYSDSCYTLTKITDESAITDEDFVITKYLGDSSSGNLTPVKYLLTFKNPLGGDPNTGSPAVRYFKWKIDENGERSLVNTGPYDTAKDITAYSSNNVRLDTASSWDNGNDVNNSFLNRGIASVILEGGAIYNASNKIIETIRGDFIANYVDSTNENTFGGAIYNASSAQIDRITGNFIGNSSSYDGGAIYNRNKIQDIAGNFIGNFSQHNGGVIYNYNGSYIENITGDFIGNYTLVSGGAMYLHSRDTRNTSVRKIKSDFINNKSEIAGGAIYAACTIDSIDGTFINNSSGDGGAIYNLVGKICNLSGDFVGNYASENGGAICASEIENLTGNFIKNFASNAGGAIYNGNIFVYNSLFCENYARYSGGAIYGANIIGNNIHFYGNYVLGIVGTLKTLKGGAIYIDKNDSVTLTNSFLNNNYVKNISGDSKTLGGAIFTQGSILNFTINKAIKSKNIGNYTETNGVKDDTNGGFLYMADSSLVNFNTEKNSSYIIGDGRSGYDSIASDATNNIINKNGKGEVVVNSSMEFYTGTLNVNEGNMTVNNKLGASRVTIANGASLSAKVNGNGSTFTNTSLNYSNDGTLNLIAGETLASGNYGVFVFENPETVYFGNVKSYGGTFDHATGTFIVENVLNLTIGETNSVNVQSNGRILAVGGELEDTSIVMNFNSTADVTVNSVFDTSKSDIDFAEIINAVNPEDLLLAEAFAFNVENLRTGDTVNLSFRVGNGYDISQFTVYHKDSESGWEVAYVTNLEYDGEYLSFIVDGFSSYGYVAAVPEASTYAVIIGAIALGLVLNRKRK